MNNKRSAIENGSTYLGIELGSTRIKAVLLGSENHQILASGDYTWQSHMEDGYFSYRMEEVWTGLKEAYAQLSKNVKQEYDAIIKKVCYIGISAMMHGYLALDCKGRVLVPFRTWQNTRQKTAAEDLSKLFEFNVPERWSISHYYQAVLNHEAHVSEIDYLTTLSGYVHYKLTGKKVLGIGDASGMFPIDSETLDYDASMLEKCDALLQEKGVKKKLKAVLPEVLSAGMKAGELSKEGALILDPSGVLAAGIPCCPPEGDAGTGMVATNAVRVHTGNVSAGTSIFSMVVLEKALQEYYEEIDMVTTPDGKPVAMVHCNNCTNDMNAWVQVMRSMVQSVSGFCESGKLYESIYEAADRGDQDCGGVVFGNFVAGEPIVGVRQGMPVMMRVSEGAFSYENFARAMLFSTLAGLKRGSTILEKENVRIDSLTGHGGLFKNGDTASRFLAASMNARVSTMPTAALGGPYGMALLAAYAAERNAESLSDYLDEVIFSDIAVKITEPDAEDVAGFDRYMEYYETMLAAVKSVS